MESKTFFLQGAKPKVSYIAGKEIAGYSMIKCVQLIRLLTRLSLFHLRG